MNCLNCNTETTGAFCHNCEQPASTSRFTIKSLFTKVLTYLFILSDKGVLYTIKQLYTSPGHSTREYIQGHRVKMTDYFTLIILVITAGLILDGFSSDITLGDLGVTYSSNGNLKTVELRVLFEEISKGFENIAGNYPRLTILMQIPFMGLSSYLWFRKKSNQNFAENIVINFYSAAGVYLFTLVFIVMCVFVKDLKFLGIVVNSIIYLSFLYSVWFYYQYYSAFGYRKSTLLFRSIFAYVIGFLLYIFTFFIIIGLKVYFSKS